MNIENKKPKIYLICGRARHGKDTIAGFLKKFYEEDGKTILPNKAEKLIELFKKRGFKFIENISTNIHHYGIIFKHE